MKDSEAREGQIAELDRRIAPALGSRVTLTLCREESFANVNGCLWAGEEDGTYSLTENNPGGLTVVDVRFSVRDVVSVTYTPEALIVLDFSRKGVQE